MNIYRYSCLLGILFSSCLWSLGTTPLRPWRALPVIAAERVSLRYDLLEFSVPVNSLETYAKTGEIDRSLAPFTQRLAPQELARLKAVLTYQANINSVIVSHFFNSPIGKRILQSVGEIVRVSPSQNGFYGLRSAFVLAAGSPEGLSLVSVMRQFPGESIHVNSRALLELSYAFIQLKEQTTRAIAAVNKQAAIEASTESTVDFAQQPNLKHSGSSTWHEETLNLFDRSRNRSLEANFYRPVIDTSVPVIVISPGLGADKSNFVYLARHLASYGFAVAVLNHPGSDRQQFEQFFAGTTREVVEAKEFINRPQDVSFLLDELQRLEQSDFSQLGSLNLKQVGMIGHSFGAYTALALAGVELNAEHLQQNCQHSDSSKRGDIVESRRHNLGWLNSSLILQCLVLELSPNAEYQLTDERIAAVFAMNPISSIFGQNLSQLEFPVVFVAGSNDLFTPALLEQIAPFTWLTVPDKYLLLIEKGTHTYGSSEALGILPDNTNFKLARQYLKAMSLAFMQTYIANESGYRLFLNSNYASFISQGSMKLNLINSLTETDLNVLQ